MRTVADVDADLVNIELFLDLLMGFDRRVSNSMEKAMYNGNEVDILSKDAFNDNYTNLLSVNTNKMFIIKLRERNGHPIVGGIQAIYNKTQIIDDKPHPDVGYMMIYNNDLGEPMRNRAHYNHVGLYFPDNKIKYPSMAVMQEGDLNLITFYANELDEGEPVILHNQTEPVDWELHKLEELPIDPSCPIGLRFEPPASHLAHWSKEDIPYSRGKYMIELATLYCEYNRWFKYRYDKDNKEYDGGDRIIISAWQTYDFLNKKKQVLEDEKVAIAARSQTEIKAGLSQGDVVRLFQMENLYTNFREYPGIVTKANIVCGYQRRFTGGGGEAHGDPNADMVRTRPLIVERALKDGIDINRLLDRFIASPEIPAGTTPNSGTYQYRMSIATYNSLSVTEKHYLFHYCIGFDYAMGSYCSNDQFFQVVITLVIAYFTGGLSSGASGWAITATVFSVLLAIGFGNEKVRKLMTVYLAIYSLVNVYNANSLANQANNAGSYGPFVESYYEGQISWSMALDVGKMAVKYNQSLMEKELKAEAGKTKEAIAEANASLKALREKRKKMVRFLYGNNDDYFNPLNKISSKFDNKYQYNNSFKFYKEFNR